MVLIYTYDIQTTNQLSVDPELRVGRPVRVLLQPLPHLVVCQDVEETVLDGVLSQDGHKLSGEAALGRARCALHEEHDWRGLDEVRQPLEQFLLGLGRVHGLVDLHRAGPVLDALVSVHRDRAGAGGLLGVCLDRIAHLDGAAAADGLEDLAVAQEDKEGHCSDIVGLANLAELLGVYGDPGGLWGAGDGVF